MRNKRAVWAAWAAVFLAFLILHAFTAWLDSMGKTGGVVRPAVGVMMAAIVLFGDRMAVVVLLSALTATLVEHFAFRHLSPGGGLIPAFLIAGSITAEAWLGAWWLRRFCGGEAAFRHGGNFLRFAAGSALVLPMIFAAIVVGCDFASNMRPWAAFGGVWLTTWLGDSVGVLVFSPLVLLWARKDFARFRSCRPLEIAALAALLLVAASAVACYGFRFPGYGFFAAMLVIPILLWIGLRLRGLGTTAALLLLTAAVIAGAVPESTAFPGRAPADSSFHLQVFLAIAAVVGLGFVTVLEESDGRIAELHRFNEELEREVTARTRKLEQINQELTEAVSIIAHDVRGPVSGIRTLAYHMRWAALDLSTKEGHELLEEIERTSAEAVEMMSRLLDLQRANDRSGGLERASIGQLVAGMCRHYELAAQQKGISLRVSHRGRDMTQLVDADGIRFIVSNLVSNALKFLHAGGAVEVRVSEGFSGCLLVVEDNGPGIADRELGCIFSRFARAANRPTAGESSTGLGLFIVRKLVLAMGGTLYVESAPGEGTAFIVEWPMEAIPAGEAPPRKSS